MKNIPKKKIVVFLLMLAVIGSVVFSQSVFGFGSHQFLTWIASPPQDPPTVSCPSFTVCAEWYTYGGGKATCCISPEQVGTHDPIVPAGSCSDGITPRDIVE